jgi:hypothetical protein
MGIKTDYLKDCITNKSITIQELINLKNQISSIPDEGAILSDVQAGMAKLDASIKVDLQKTKSEINNKVDEKISQIASELNAQKERLEEIYNKVIQFKYKTVAKIIRNMNKDIVKIIFTDKYYIEVEYSNLPYENEYINYMPTKINYYDNAGNLIAIEEIKYQNESIIGLNNKNF